MKRNNKMETITREYKVYEFKELKPEVQRRVLDKMAQHELESEWWEPEIEGIAYDLKELYGIDVKSNEVYFDLYQNWFALGTHSTIDDAKKFLKSVADNKVLLAQIIANPEWDINRVDLDIQTDRNGESNSIGVACNGYNYEDGDERWEEDQCKEILESELGIKLDDCIDKINREMLKRLREQQDYIQSDENIKMRIEDNEYKFLENGEIFN
jgi:hypothetical protein